MKRTFLFLSLLVCIPLLVAAQVNHMGKYVGGIYVDAAKLQNDAHQNRSPGDTLYSFPTPSNWPGGLAWDGQFFWNSDHNSFFIYKLDSLGNIMTSFPVPPGSNGGGGLAWDGTNLWMVDETNAKLYKIDPITGLPLGSFNLPDSTAPDPNCWGLTWDGAYLWVSQYYTDLIIYKIDPTNGQVIHSFPTPDSFVLGIEWVDNYIYGIDVWTQILYKMNPLDGSVVYSMPWQVPYPLGLTWDGSYWWNVSSGSAAGGNECIYKVEDGSIGISDNSSHTQTKYINDIKCYPNPFNATTTVQYEVISNGYVEIAIYDIQGKLIKTLVHEDVSSGTNTIMWHGYDNENKKAPGGVYFLKFKNTDYISTSKLLLIR